MGIGLFSGGQSDTFNTLTVTNLTVTGSFTSVGIDDNATSTAITIDSSDNVTFAQDIIGDTLLSGSTTGAITIAGGSTSTLGGRAVFYGQTHASKPDDIEFFGSASLSLHYDDSLTIWDFQANDITTTGDITAGGDLSENGALLSATYLALAGGDLTGNITYAIDEGVTTVLNFANGNTGEVSISGNTTFTFSNIPATGKTAIYTLFLVVTSTATPTFTGVTDFNLGITPGALAVGKYIFTFTTHDGGTVMLGIQSFSSV